MSKAWGYVKTYGVAVAGGLAFGWLALPYIVPAVKSALTPSPAPSPAITK